LERISASSIHRRRIFYDEDEKDNQLLGKYVALTSDGGSRKA
jgi:hypothetical protein